MNNFKKIIARAKRNKLQELADDSFRGPDSDKIREINVKNEGAILGVESDSGQYTVIGLHGFFIKNSDGHEFFVNFDEAIPYLQENGMKVGKGGNFEFVEFGPKGLVWMKNGPTMCALWNIVLLMRQRKN